MNGDQYVLWFIAMAVLISLILGVGTLAAAGLIHRPARRERVPGATRREEGRHAEVHHWYDRFTHHHHHAA